MSRPEYEWPLVTVVIHTYNRPVELEKCIVALWQHLEYPRLHFLVSDDSTPIEGYPENVIEKVLGFINQRGIELSQDCISWISTKQNGGWGANANNALNHVRSDFVFFCEDDYILHQDIDLRLPVALMENHPGIGLVRYDGLAGHDLRLIQDEVDIRHHLPNWRQGMGQPGKLYYMLVDAASPALNVYSNRPHIKHRRFHKFYGRYATGKMLGQTEDDMAHRVKDKMHQTNAPMIAVLDGWITRWFDDIGKSFQHTPEDD